MNVDFLIIGAPKCGTSALAAYLAAHPEVCFSRPKEPHFYYRSPTVPCPATTPEEYFRCFFTHYDPAVHRLCGEGTPRILGAPEALGRLLEANPDVKLLVMLRDPVEMFFSWHREMLRGLEEDREDPAEAWRLREARRDGKSIPKTCRDPRNLQYGDICGLGSQLEALYDRVDASQVHVIPQRDLLHAPSDSLRGVCGFLGISVVEPARPLRVNVTCGRRSAAAFKLYRAAFRCKRALLGSRPLPAFVSGGLRRLVFSSRPEDRPPVEEAFQEELERWFDVERGKLKGLGAEV